MKKIGKREDYMRRMELMIVKGLNAAQLFNDGCHLLNIISRDFHNRKQNKQS